MQSIEQIVYACLIASVGNIAFDKPCALQHAGNIKKLPRIERTAEIRAV